MTTKKPKYIQLRMRDTEENQRLLKELRHKCIDKGLELVEGTEQAIKAWLRN